MKNCMKDMAKMLGVEIGEVFKIDLKPHCFFRFTHKCLQVSVIPDFWFMGSDDYLRLVNPNVLAVSNMLAVGLANLFMGLTDLRARKLLINEIGEIK